MESIDDFTVLQIQNVLQFISTRINSLRLHKILIYRSIVDCSLNIYICSRSYLFAGLTSLESSSMDDVVTLCKTLDFPTDQLLENISRVLKPGGSVLFHLDSQTVGEQMVVFLGSMFSSLVKM